MSGTETMSRYGAYRRLVDKSKSTIIDSLLMKLSSGRGRPWLRIFLERYQY